MRSAGRTLRSGTLLAGTGAAYVGLVDPHRPGSPYPPCPFRLLTGWNCPACGGLRMVHDLLHADLPAAVLDNVFLLGAIPLLAAWLLVLRGRRPVPALTVIAVAAIAWTLIRNLPGFPLVPVSADG